jgi:glutathione peroxidase-family protein
MTDKDVIDYFYDSDGNVLHRANHKKTVPSEIQTYFDARYKDSNLCTNGEILFRMIHNIDEKPKCKICGKYLPFHKNYAQYDSTECSKQGRKMTCLEKYGVKFASQSNEVKEKVKNTCLKKYGVESFTQAETFKQKTRATCLKKYGSEYWIASSTAKNTSKQTCIERYDVEFASQSNEVKEKVKNTCLKKYGVEWPTQLKQCRNLSDEKKLEKKQKEYETKKKNNSLFSSSAEDQFAKWLEENNYDFVRQYRSTEYPFNCDFYFPQLDLYVEIQGHWTHGGHPYDEHSENDKAIVDFWKNTQSHYYANATYTWTDLDVRKRNIAKQNGINYVEIFAYKLNEIVNQFLETQQQSVYV